jgi:hypothetical protein
MKNKYDPRGCFSAGRLSGKATLIKIERLEAENEALKQSINLMNINGYAPETLHKFLTELEAENAVLQEENKKLREALEEVKELTGGEYDYYVYNVAEKALNETK